MKKNKKNKTKDNTRPLEQFLEELYLDVREKTDEVLGGSDGSSFSDLNNRVKRMREEHPYESSEQFEERLTEFFAELDEKHPKLSCLLHLQTVMSMWFVKEEPEAPWEQEGFETNTYDVV